MQFLMSEVPLYLQEKSWTVGTRKTPPTRTFPTHARCTGPRPAEILYRGTSFTKQRTPIGPYLRPMPRVLGES